MEIVVSALVLLSGVLAALAMRFYIQARLGEEAAARLTAVESHAAILRTENAGLKAELEAERRAAAERLTVLNDAQTKLGDAFKALSAEALHANSENFLRIARETLSGQQDSARHDLQHRQSAIDELVRPLKDSLAKVDSRIQELEVARTSAYSVLTEQVKSLSVTQAQLQNETANLVRALRAPATRGRWGELQLQRVVEMAGMLEHCDFTQQETVQTEDGRRRPDLIIHLPGARRIVVDSKAPLAAYLDACESADDQQRRGHIRQHAAQVRQHIAKLAAKAYWEQFQPAPEFVVAFLPGETFFGAALEQDAEIIEYGIGQRVLLATPTTLIALLKTIALSWRQESIAQHALEISSLGKEIYERLRTYAAHFSCVGESLDKAVGHYNRAVGTLETRVLVAARRMKEKGVSASEEITALEPVERTVRTLQAPELVEPPAGGFPN